MEASIILTAINHNNVITDVLYEIGECAFHVLKNLMFCVNKPGRLIYQWNLNTGSALIQADILVQRTECKNGMHGIKVLTELDVLVFACDRYLFSYNLNSKETLILAVETLAQDYFKIWEFRPSRIVAAQTTRNKIYLFDMDRLVEDKQLILVMDIKDRLFLYNVDEIRVTQSNQLVVYN